MDELCWTVEGLEEIYQTSIKEKQVKDSSVQAETLDWQSFLDARDNEGFPDFAKLREKRPDAGCTANMCLFIENHVICANIGDSRTNILNDDGYSLPLSVDHKPTNKDE